MPCSSSLHPNNTSESGEDSLTNKPSIIVASLVVANFLAQLMQTMLNTALPRVMQDLAIHENQAQWLITVYYLMIGITVPVAGFLIGKFTTRALFMASVGAFTAGTLIAGIAWSFPLVLTGRLVQGIGAGLLFPLFQTTILRVFPKEKIGAAMGVVGLVLGLAPALGPTLSGFVVQNHSWRLLFYAVAPLAAANLFLAHFTLRNVGETHQTKLDTRSIIYSSLGFAGILYGFSIVGEEKGNPVVAGIILLAGFLIVALFIKRQLKLTAPLLDFKLFRHRSFTRSSIVGVILFAVMVGVELLLPLYAQTIRGLTPRESGLMLLPGALLIGVSGLISGRLYDRFGVSRVTQGGFLLILIMAAALFLTLSTETSFNLLVIMYALLMFGVGAVMAPITAYAMASIPNTMVAHASPMTITLRSLSGSIGGALLVTIMTSTASASSLSFPLDMLKGVHIAFWTLTAFAGLGLYLSFHLQEARKLKPANI